MKKKHARPLCRKVHRLTVTRTIRCNSSNDHVVNASTLPAGFALYARIEAAIDPVHLTELATLFECDRDGTSTDTIHYNVPYSALRFDDAGPPLPNSNGADPHKNA